MDDNPEQETGKAVALARYDAMLLAIEAAYQVDEVKDIHDKAWALEVYAAQARNTEAERRACEIRLRAERRAGELLREREKARPGPKPSELGSATQPNSALSLDDLGISKRQSHTWQRLAEVPQERFEKALADPTRRPTTVGIIRAASPSPKPSPPKTLPPGLTKSALPTRSILAAVSGSRARIPAFSNPVAWGSRNR